MKTPDRILVEDLKNRIDERDVLCTKSIDLVIGSDHGQGQQRCALKVIMENINNEDAKVEVFTFGIVTCKKDTDEVLSKTIYPHINKGVEKILENSHVMFLKEGKKLKVSLANLSPDSSISATNNHPNAIASIPIINLCATGDLAFYSSALGKKSASAWCPYCPIRSKDRNLSPNERPTLELWTLSKMREFVVKKKHESSKAEIHLGVECLPRISSIEVHNCIVPILHMLIGLVNNAVDKMYEHIDLCLEKVPTALKLSGQKVVKSKIAVADAEIKINCVVDEINDIDFEISCMRESLDQEDDIKDLVENAIVILEDRKVQLEIELCKKREQLALLRSTSRDCVTKDKDLRKERKYYEKSLSILIEEALKNDCNIERPAYHSGQYIGTMCKKFLELRKKVLHIIVMIIKANRHENMLMTDEEIDVWAESYEQLFGCLDRVFSLLRKERWNVVEQDYIDLDDAIKKAMVMWRRLELLFTPKAHILETHAVEQMKRFGGIGQYAEDFIELCHQIGLRHRKLTSHTLNFQMAMKSEFQSDCLSNLKEVKAIKDRNDERCKRKRSNDEIASSQRKKRMKVERDDARVECINEVVVIGSERKVSQGWDFRCSKEKSRNN